jgi:hypothetical protein
MSKPNNVGFTLQNAGNWLDADKDANVDRCSLDAKGNGSFEECVSSL